jgi:hypothetical protein
VGQTFTGAPLRHLLDSGVGDVGTSRDFAAHAIVNCPLNVLLSASQCDTPMRSLASNSSKSVAAVKLLPFKNSWTYREKDID